MYVVASITVSSTGKSEPKNVFASHRALLFVLVLALLTRLVVFALNHPFAPLDKDDVVYDQLGWSLAIGQGFSIVGEPLSWRTPGYPGFLAIVYTVAGRSADAVRLVQIALSLLTCVLVYIVGRRILDHRAAIVATGVCAVWPQVVWLPMDVLTEANQALFVLCLLYCAQWTLARDSSISSFVMCGLLLGIATLCRPDYQFLTIGIGAAMVLLAPGRRRRMFLGVAIMTVTFAATVTPWIVRNYRVFGQNIGLASGSGLVLMAAKFEAEGDFGPQMMAKLRARYGADFERRFGRPMMYIDGAIPEQDRILRRDFVAFVKSEPLVYAKHSMMRLYNLWQPHSFSEVLALTGDFSEYRTARAYPQLAAKFALLVVDAVFLGAAFLGMLLALPRWRQFLLPLVVVAYVSIIYGLANGYARYRGPVLPLLSLFVAFAAQELVSRYKRRS